MTSIAGIAKHLSTDGTPPSLSPRPPLPTTPPPATRPCLPLVLLTLLAACLRFACLARPEVWGDEAATFHRVTSSYTELLAHPRTT